MRKHQILHRMVDESFPFFNTKDSAYINDFVKEVILTETSFEKEARTVLLSGGMHL
jgi:hypothetical protein